MSVPGWFGCETNSQLQQRQRKARGTPQDPCGPQEMQQPTPRCRPHRAGFEAGTRGLRADEPWELGPSTRYHTRVSADEGAGQGCSPTLHPPVSGRHRLVSRGRSGDLWSATRETPDICLLRPRWPQAAGAYAGVGPGLGDPSAWPCGLIVPTPPRVPQCPPPLPGEAGPGVPQPHPSPAQPHPSPALLGAWSYQDGGQLPSGQEAETGWRGIKTS